MNKKYVLNEKVAVIEFARNVLENKGANSAEFVEENDDSVVIFMPEIDKKTMGGNMRLGARETILREGSMVSEIYGRKKKISERHRHRYEINPLKIQSFEKNGFVFSGKDETGKRMEVFEYKKNRFHMGVQYHPEFKNNPRRFSPIIYSFLKSAYISKVERKEKFDCKLKN